ncbi:hypothetical protein DBR43_09600 [Pedobacter sp. KBW06]|uniref:FecR family protein n=1 Tax=Pedobacter sp. KBW06 TaxID=2153359 RepID=UPI000F5A7C26|nr:FecR family protein [Pedobacter sp. KBW06]RQO75581.1 hypothetical protein DBR43_09600 [Pedobacter sp. KBW06]
MQNKNQRRRLENLAYKWLVGDIKKVEREEFDKWFGQVDDTPMEISADIATSRSELETLLFNKIMQKIQRKKTKVKHFNLWHKVTTAAAILLIVSTCLDFHPRTTKQKSSYSVNNYDVAPGRNSATLTLSNGKKITLSGIEHDLITEEAGIDISETAAGQLIYKLKKSRKALKNRHTLSTARGENYHIRLPDGSLVWLNASSSLTYDIWSTEHKARKVELSGEAYFEVAKNKNKPFIVTTGLQQITVLGTHFNINAYQDTGPIKTTLLEGSVKVDIINSNVVNYHSRLLKKDTGKVLVPGEQSLVSFGRPIKVVEVNPEEELAWKNGIFLFSKEPIETIMMRVARWYDVEVIYQPGFKSKLFTGAVSRFEHISSVLKILELTGGVHFKIEGRRLFVM